MPRPPTAKSAATRGRSRLPGGPARLRSRRSAEMARCRSMRSGARYFRNRSPGNDLVMGENSIPQMLRREFAVAQIHHAYLMVPGMRLDDPGGQLVAAIVQQVENSQLRVLPAGHVGTHQRTIIRSAFCTIIAFCNWLPAAIASGRASKLTPLRVALSWQKLMSTPGRRHSAT